MLAICNHLCCSGVTRAYLDGQPDFLWEIWWIPRPYFWNCKVGFTVERVAVSVVQVVELAHFSTSRSLLSNRDLLEMSFLCNTTHEISFPAILQLCCNTGIHKNCISQIHSNAQGFLFENTSEAKKWSVPFWDGYILDCLLPSTVKIFGLWTLVSLFSVEFRISTVSLKGSIRLCITCRISECRVINLNAIPGLTDKKLRACCPRRYSRVSLVRLLHPWLIHRHDIGGVYK